MHIFIRVLCRYATNTYPTILKNYHPELFTTRASKIRAWDSECRDLSEHENYFPFPHSLLVVKKLSGFLPNPSPIQRRNHLIIIFCKPQPLTTRYPTTVSYTIGGPSYSMQATSPKKNRNWCDLRGNETYH